MKAYVKEVRCRQLREDDLETRVLWLQDNRVRDGITISYWPDMGSMKRWFEGRVVSNAYADYVLDGPFGERYAMFGLAFDSARREASFYGYVNPQMFGHGIGRVMMNHVKALAELERLESIWLETKCGNVRARRLYEGAGFQIHGHSKDGNRVRMRLQCAR